MIDIQDLGHGYADGHQAIDGVHLRVSAGELVSIVGPSGCGKSTLLRCVAGLLKPTRVGCSTTAPPWTGSRTTSRSSSRSTAAR